ncbi:hypothetical protein NG791_08855 [Laspinema sp. D1]|uniref:hypothetical protein n=1 Tax=Laspinema palackyanum TaxID=3231601 RepID=UPI00349423BB|nr:hypothetical protein [Laspinema sp. D2b]
MAASRNMSGNRACMEAGETSFFLRNARSRWRVDPTLTLPLPRGGDRRWSQLSSTTRFLVPGIGVVEGLISEIEFLQAG